MVIKLIRLTIILIWYEFLNNENFNLQNNFWIKNIIKNVYVYAKSCFVYLFYKCLFNRLKNVLNYFKFSITRLFHEIYYKGILNKGSYALFFF